MCIELPSLLSLPYSGTVSRPVFVFHDLHIFKRKQPIILQMPLNTFLSDDGSSWLDSGHAVLAHCHGDDAVLLREWYQEGHDNDVSPPQWCWPWSLVSGGLCQVSPWQSHSRSLCKMLSLMCVRTSWDYVTVLFLRILVPTGFSIHWWFLPETVIAVVVSKGWFSNFNISSTFISWNPSVNKSFPFSSVIYSFIHLFISV